MHRIDAKGFGDPSRYCELRDVSSPSISAQEIHRKLRSRVALPEEEAVGQPAGWSLSRVLCRLGKASLSNRSYPAALVIDRRVAARESMCLQSRPGKTRE